MQTLWYCFFFTCILSLLARKSLFCTSWVLIYICIQHVQGTHVILIQVIINKLEDVHVRNICILIRVNLSNFNFIFNMFNVGKSHLSIIFIAYIVYIHVHVCFSQILPKQVFFTTLEIFKAFGGYQNMPQIFCSLLFACKFYLND